MSRILEAYVRGLRRFARLAKKAGLGGNEMRRVTHLSLLEAPLALGRPSTVSYPEPFL